MLRSPCLQQRERDHCRRVAMLLVLTSVLISGRTVCGEQLSWLEGGGFTEEIRSEVDVGGLYAAGVFQGSAFQPANPKEMFVWLPTDAGLQLCVTVRSIDGVYVAEGQFAIGDQKAGRYALEFGAEHPDVLRRYGQGELILDGRVGEDCDRRESLSHVPMAWTRDAKRDRLVVFVNVDGHEGRLFVPLREDGEKIREVPCEDLESELSHRVFSAFCTLDDIDEIDLTQGWLEIRRFGQRMAWESVKVSVPDTESSP